VSHHRQLTLFANFVIFCSNLFLLCGLCVPCDFDYSSTVDTVGGADAPKLAGKSFTAL
jgi:hypothetical protein